MAFRSDGTVRAFRIADRRHLIFDGAGSYLHGARWTSKGRRVIYAGETYAGALLEILVHLNLREVPLPHVCIEVTVPSLELIEQVEPDRIPGWDRADLSASREFGDRWYAERRTPVLFVPAVVTQGIEHNVLLNQEHPLFSSIFAGPPADVNWDERLFEP